MTQEFLSHLSENINKVWEGQLHLNLPIRYMQDFVNWMKNPLEDKNLQMSFWGQLYDLRFEDSSTSIERVCGEEVATVKVGDFDFLLDDE